MLGTEFATGWSTPHEAALFTKPLTPQSVRFFTRNGVSIMPMFRKTEVSDGDLDAVAAYLTRRRAAAAGTLPAPERK